MRRTVVRRCALAGAGLALVPALVPGSAAAGTYTVANCASDPSNYNTQAFGHFATRGMRIRRACDPKGTGVRGLIIGNVARRGTVKRKAMAQIAMEAPAGTSFGTLSWSGMPTRVDCRYAMMMWAEVPNSAPITIFNLPANKACPKKRRAQVAQLSEKAYDVTGATRIVQRVICAGGGGYKSCSTAGANEIRTFRAAVTIHDDDPPSAAIRVDTPLAAGEWVSSGEYPLNYDAADNVGVRSAWAMVGSVPGEVTERGCRFALAQESFADQVPCPDGPGQVTVRTDRLNEGSQPLAVRVQDPAGNFADAPPLTARIDRTAPSRVDVGVEGGEDWRSRNDFAVAWTNPDEGDRAPIVAAAYQVCPAAGGACTRGEHAGAGVSGFAVSAPGPGQWTVSLWRRDAAGNQDQQMASVPVTLRYDPDAPQLGFEPPPASDPTLVAVKVSDAVSGVADGAIEISAAGAGVWHALPVHRDGDRMLTRIDDAGLPAGPYELRARAVDQARNEASTNLRLDGQPMLVNLPVRIVSSMQTAFERGRTVRETVRRNGRTRRINRPSIVLTQTARVLFGETAQIAGRLVNPDGNGIPGAEVHVLATTPLGPEQLVAVVQTDAEGRYRYTAAGSTNRTLRFAYAGSPVILPAQSGLAMTVPAATVLAVDRKRLRNGQAVTFSGPVQTLPTPPGGKLVEMQVRLPGRWETFRTIRSDDAGQWQVRYRFRRTSGVAYYRFRARLPAEGAYAFTAGVSRVVTVRVRGRS